MRKHLSFFLYLYILFIPNFLITKTNNVNLMCGQAFPCKNQENLINFWIKVSTKYTSKQGLLHNRYTMQEYSSLNTNKKQEIRILKKQISKSKKIKYEDIRFQRGFKDKFTEGLKKSIIFKQSIESILSNANLNKDLFFLTLTESAFNPFALSKQGALGVWQITKTCWQDFLPQEQAFLRVDPIYSTFVASDFLKKSLDTFRDYSLAITAYNYGIDPLSNAIATLKTKNIKIISKVFEDKNLGFAVKNFYASFLASRFVAKKILKTNSDYIEHNKKFIYLVSPVKFDKNFNFINPNLNPVVEYLKYVPKFYPIRLYPENLSKITSTIVSLLIKEKDVANNSTSITKEFINIYKIEKGDSLLYLARKFKTTVKALMKLNHINRANRVFIGQKIKIKQTKTIMLKPKKKNIKKKIPINLNGIKNWERLYEYLIKNKNNVFFISNNGDLVYYNNINIKNYKRAVGVYQNTKKEFNLKEALNDEIFNVYFYNEKQKRGLVYLAPWESIDQLSKILKNNIYEFTKIPFWRNMDYKLIPISFEKVNVIDFTNKRKTNLLSLYQEFFKSYSIEKAEDFDIDIVDMADGYPSYILYFYNPNLLFISLEKLKEIRLPKLKRYGVIE